jgi:uncharacterized protein (DUF983 family)
MLYTNDLKKMGLPTTCPRCGSDLLFVGHTSTNGEMGIICTREEEEGEVAFPPGTALSEILNYLTHYGR